MLPKKQSHKILSRTLELEWKKSKEKKLARIIKTDDQIHVKGTVSVIASDPPCKDDIARVITKPLKNLSFKKKRVLESSREADKEKTEKNI